MLFYIFFVFSNIQSFILDSLNYSMINEINNYENNYSVDQKTIKIIKLYKNTFKNNYLPLAFNFSTKQIAKIFKLVFDFITTENFYDIDNIFKYKFSLNEGFDFDRMSFLFKKILNKNDDFCKNEGMFFDKNILLMKYTETIDFVFCSEFIRTIDLSKIFLYFDYISKIPFFKTFSSKIIFLEYNDKYIQMSLPEYFILGLYCFLTSQYDEITNKRYSSNNLCL